MLRGHLYHAFGPELWNDHDRCSLECKRFNTTTEVSRRALIKLWRDVNNDARPLPPQLPDEDADAALFNEEPLVERPLFADYGYNVRLVRGMYINRNCTFIDAGLISIRHRTLIRPNCSFCSGTHIADSAVRDGINGPEFAKEIHVGEDCWLGGNFIVLPGITVGKGATIGPGSVVTKDVPAFHVVAGNPARILRKIPIRIDDGSEGLSTDAIPWKEAAHWDTFALVGHYNGPSNLRMTQKATHALSLSQICVLSIYLSSCLGFSSACTIFSTPH